MEKKVLLTATVQSHIGQFHRPLAEVLHENGYEVHVAARDNLAEKNGLQLDFADKVYDVPFARSPLSLSNIKAYKELKNILKEEQYDVIHCNTPMGGIVTRLAARKARRKGTKVIYTAHGFHFCKGSPKKNWMIYYPIERTMSFFCDTLVTITREDYALAAKNFHCDVKRMHGVGVYTDRYHEVSKEEALAMREKEGLSGDDFVILCTGELNKNKNQKTLIAATEILKRTIPQIKVLFAGNGPLEEELKAQIAAADLENNVILLGYRTDLETITPSVDLVVSCSHREGLPLNILEAMLCKKPVVASHNRGHNELVKDEVSGFLVDADDVNGYAISIFRIYKEKKMAEKMGRSGYKRAQKYTADAVKEELKEIYGL